jgi:pimeloyl-ACP methyl ester carboxylesterase
MATTARNSASDIRGLSRLAIDATTGVTGVVEAMHRNLSFAARLVGGPEGRTRGITGLVYQSIRGTASLVGVGIDAALAPLVPFLGEQASSPKREAAVAVLNGVVGDHLARTRNPLAIRLRLRRDGRPLPSDNELGAALPRATGKIAVFVHGLCMGDLSWRRGGEDYAAALERDLGWTSLHLHYNTGLRIATNGRELAEALDGLVARWPVPVDELALLGHSMGGLVARSACHHGAAAGHGWPPALRRLVCLGTPHLGAPFERAGNWVETFLGRTPYIAPLTALGRIRSAGINDLRHGCILDEDCDHPTRLPLPDGVDAYSVAATTAPREDARSLLGDGLVPVSSALAAFPEDRRRVVRGANHMDLLGHSEVYEHLRRWMS